MIRKFVHGLAVVAGLFLVTGCESIFGPLSGIGTFETGAAGGELPADVSVTQRVGDRLFGEAASPEVRAARQEMAVAAYAYLLSDRVARFDPQIADQALGRLQSLRGTLAGRSLSADDAFPETMLGEITIELVAIAVDTGLERATGFAGLFAGRPNISGLLLRGRVAARQAYFVNLLVTDIRGAVVRMNKDPAFIAAARRQSTGLLCHSENRVRAVAGAVPLDCGPPAPAEIV